MGTDRLAKARRFCETEAVPARSQDAYGLANETGLGQPADEPAAAPAAAVTFPKVLRRRLDKFFADQKISPKADGAMWTKIAVGLAVLLGSWIAIYAMKPAAGIFVLLYVLGGLA